MLVSLLSRWRDDFVRLVGMTPSQALSYLVSCSTTFIAVAQSLEAGHLALPATVQAGVCWLLSVCRSIQAINDGIPVHYDGIPVHYDGIPVNNDAQEHDDAAK